MNELINYLINIIISCSPAAVTDSTNQLRGSSSPQGVIGCVCAGVYVVPGLGQGGREPEGACQPMFRYQLAVHPQRLGRRRQTRAHRQQVSASNQL